MISSNAILGVLFLAGLGRLGYRRGGEQRRSDSRDRRGDPRNKRFACVIRRHDGLLLFGRSLPGGNRDDFLQTETANQPGSLEHGVQRVANRELANHCVGPHVRHFPGTEYHRVAALPGKLLKRVVRRCGRYP